MAQGNVFTAHSRNDGTLPGTLVPFSLYPNADVLLARILLVLSGAERIERQSLSECRLVADAFFDGGYSCVGIQTQKDPAMPRIKELVRIATLERHYQEGIVAAVEIIEEGGRWGVCVRYNESAEGVKTRFLTTQRIPGPRRFRGLETAWKILEQHGVAQASVRKATAEEGRYFREWNS